jgi:exonuclease III
MTKLRFASWNVNYRRFAAQHLAVLQSVQPDVIALQEVSPKFHHSMTEAGMFGCSLFSLQLLPAQNLGTKARRIGCSIFAREPFSLTSGSVLDGLAFPERSLVASVEAKSLRFTACSFHTPPGSNWDAIKPQTLETLARWLACQATLLVVGIDANAPKTDHPDIHRNEWWWDSEPYMLGGEPIHMLKDAYRLFLEAHPEELARIVQARPRGPLAVSHIRGTGIRKTECRYDFIYVSPGVVVRHASYRFEEAVRAASDHAVVVVDLEIPQK